MSRFITIVSLLGALLLASVAPVGAQEDFSTTRTGTQADAFWQDCTPDVPEPGLQTCRFHSVFALDGSERSKGGTGKPSRQADQACVSIGEAVLTGTGEFVEDISNEFGCTGLNGVTFTVASDLSSASLTGSITVQSFTCGPTGCVPSGGSRTVGVDVDWTATGPLTSFREQSVSHSTFDGEWCLFKSSGRGERRAATATGAIDGTTLGTSTFAQIVQGRTSFTNRCA